jgi:hypothetical protein
MMSIMLSFWCATMFVAGQQLHVPRSLVWLLGLMAIFAFLLGCVSSEMQPRPRHVLSIGLGVAVAAIGLAGLALRAMVWLPFCALFGATWYLTVIVAELLWSPRDRGTMAPSDS